MTFTTNKENVLSINGFDMYYEIHGNGYPLLMLHGFTGSSAGLGTNFKELSKDHTLIVPDLRGHGRSTNPSKQFSFRQAALDVIALLEQLAISQCSAVGFSGGGCTLLQVAYQKPEQLRSMAIVSAAPYFPQQTRDMMKKLAFQIKTEEQWHAMRSIHLQGDEQIEMLWEQANTLSESYDDMNFTPEMLSAIKTKTFIVQGDRDPFYPIELTVEMYKALPNAYLWIIPGGSHVPISSEAPEDFIANLRKFLPV